ncbi:hypothetical protein UFOVP1247_249 [uncultured Caudovirales phage]|uniref:Uncharacterized protein n=1 Tax=uncultured Caudovirales phage TaxID=2100421 RepID=A0A6J5Q7S0_9CAUD|nr:hypothetical protein UFOVP970_289 [uncultured Caudovirales phage]CAB4193878.1 hypothetical protein UFOVP1247_249 [uncultured Caudovirales phage]
MDENKLISLMENFSGAKFQWIKTNRPELLGKVVTCRNIEPRGDKFFAMFDDGSSVDSTQLNTSLMMIHGDMQPLTRAEVESISGPKKPIPPRPQAMAGTGPIDPGIPLPNAGQPYAQPYAQPTPQAPPSVNMFEMFNSEERQINLLLSINLPDQDFLRMMYANAKDKNKFLGELSDYVFNVINKTVVQDSISSMVVPPAPIIKERSGSAVNITEIHD